MKRRTFLSSFLGFISIPFIGFASKKEVLVKTGWKAFDKALGGGLKSGGFVVVKYDSLEAFSLFMSNLWKRNSFSTIEIWEFDQSILQKYAEKDHAYGGPFLITPMQNVMIRDWYNYKYSMMQESHKVIISPHGKIGSLFVTSSDYFADVGISANKTDDPNVFRYIITKNRHGDYGIEVLLKNGEEI